MAPVAMDLTWYWRASYASLYNYFARRGCIMPPKTASEAQLLKKLKSLDVRVTKLEKAKPIRPNERVDLVGKTQTVSGRIRRTCH
jgi:hypothetical protein